MASNLTVFYKTPTQDSDLNNVQNVLVRTLNPVFSMPLMGGNLLTNQTLTTGSNSINTGLSRELTGWIIVRQRAAAAIYDTQDTNKTPTMTLQLTSSAPVVLDLYVF